MVTEAEVRWLMEPDTRHEPSVLFELLRHRPVWMARAACRGESLELFFPGRGADVRPAKALCERCPVRRECLESVVDDRTTIGVWGGTSDVQRRRIRSERALDEAS